MRFAILLCAATATAHAGTRHVDAARGADTGDGSPGAPWKTLQVAVGKLAPGDTLIVHAGTYFEAVTVAASGTAAAPITIRAAPGEVAIVDGGLREFEESPKTAWEPVGDGEYRSTATYPAISSVSEQGRGVFVTGNFADSMIPLHGYKFAEDLRSKNEYWNLTENLKPTNTIYVGPGVWLDPATHRIHARLAPTHLRSQASYKGESDPRKLALVVGIDRVPLRITGSYVHVEGLLVRGSATHTVHVENAAFVDLDGLTIYGGSPALFVKATHHLRLLRSRLHGLAAPWSSRASMKYRGDSPYLVIADPSGAQSHDWEFAYNDFTDGHDGIVVDSIRGLRFHHNRVENFNDDGLYLTLPPRAHVPEDLQIYENVFARVLTAFSFAQPEDGSPNTIGTGAYIYRNVFDLREGTYSWPAKDAAADVPGAPLAPSKMCGDHGSPTWEPMYFYNNTVVTAGPAFRDYYGAQMVAGTLKSTRRIFDNVFVQLDGKPGLVFPRLDDDLAADGNVLWSASLGPQPDFLAAFRASPAFEQSKKRYPPGFGAHDVYADPVFGSVARGAPLDVRPGAKSAAIDAGIAIPAAWPDSLRASDRGKPDAGALPAGAPMLVVGPAAAPKP